MKIHNKLTTPLAGEVTSGDRTGRSTPAAVRDSTRTESVDVQLSELASQLQAIQGQLASGEVVDAARIAEIRQAIAEGRLKIHPDMIADRLLETVKELLTVRRPG